MASLALLGKYDDGRSSSRVDLHYEGRNARIASREALIRTEDPCNHVMIATVTQSHGAFLPSLPVPKGAMNAGDH